MINTNPSLEQTAKSMQDAIKNMPAHKVGKNWKFKVSEIDKWIKEGQAEEQ